VSVIGPVYLLVLCAVAVFVASVVCHTCRGCMCKVYRGSWPWYLVILLSDCRWESMSSWLAVFSRVWFHV